MAVANSTQGPAPVSRSSNGTPLFECVCVDCGKVRIADRRKLNKPCMSCANKRRATHGLSGHPLYKLLVGVRARCEYPSATNYKYYGGRGIKVCDEWRSDPAAFVAWAEEHGYLPGMELDRKDSDGPYDPSNCQFIAHDKNSRKRRNAQCDEETALQVRRLLAGGASVKAAADAAGVKYMVAWHISKGNTWK